MDFLALAQPISHVIGTIQLDDNSMSVLAMLAGIISGWTITNYLRPKAKKIKVERKDDAPPPEA